MSTEYAKCSYTSGLLQSVVYEWLSKFPADGAQTQMRSWTSIFLTSCTRLRMYRSLEVMIPSAGNFVQSCGHSRSFSVLDHVKNFTIVSASALCLVCKKNRADESTTCADVIIFWEGIFKFIVRNGTVPYHTIPYYTNDKFTVCTVWV